MPRADDTYVYDPLDRTTFEAIAYNAIGRGSETNTYPAYHLTHSSGASGWSVGFLQWDFGQPGRGDKVPELLSGYQGWAPAASRFSAAEIESLTHRLQTRGQHGNALTEVEQTRLNDYLRSDPGRMFVNSLDSEQITYKWTNVGQPLADIPWLQQLRQSDAPQSAEIVAMAAKRFNQGEARGRELIQHLRGQETTSTDLSTWIETVSARAPANRAAIVSGRDNALSAIDLVNSLEVGTGHISQAWREQVHVNGNTGLSTGFNTSADLQLLDAMMRNPAAGHSILQSVEHGARVGPVTITGINQTAREEMARVELSRDGELSVTPPGGVRSVLTATGWVERPVPQHDRHGPARRDRLPTDGHHRPEHEPRRQGDAPEQPQGRSGPGAANRHAAAEVDTDVQPLRASAAVPAGFAPVRKLPSDLRDTEHPGHTAYTQSLDDVRRMEVTAGIGHGEHSERLAAAVAITAERERMQVQRLDMTKDGQIFAVERGPAPSFNERRVPIDTHEAMSKDMAVLSQEWLNARSPHYRAGQPAEERTAEQAQALAQLSPRDQAMFARIRADVPAHVSDDVVAQSMLAAKHEGVRDAGAIGQVVIANDRLFVTGKIPGQMAMTDISAPAPALAQTVAQVDGINHQHQQHDVQMQQQMAQQSQGQAAHTRVLSQCGRARRRPTPAIRRRRLKCLRNS